MKPLMIITYLCYILFIGGVASKTFPKILWIYWSQDYSDDRLIILFE